MRRLIPLLLLSGLALPAGFAQSALADNLSVALDEVQTVHFPLAPAAVNVGNPAIVDITMIDDRNAFILGKAYGATNIIAVGKGGEVISNTHVSVLNGQQATVTLQRGTARTTYNCTVSRCEAAPQPGDGKDSFDTANAQITAHQDSAKKAATPQQQ
ncbi:MAG: pilus assembly protein N-terminal domain-containing protein [Alphaproteobacteria bacterium]|nr:pilus assembly protein N-terminal domain-containing protein [Alphaproteobacteria bacterium]